MNNLTAPNCPDCGHAKFQHPVALGFCMVCQALDMRGLLTGKRCNRVFASIFSQGEIEQYARVSRDSFDQWAVCAVCEAYWMEHMGALCPSGNSTFKPLVGNS
jgi:hypothetical protein